MKKISRRSFIKTGAAAAAVTIATPLLPRGLYSLARADTSGYFENEFGITDSLCQKVLAEALSRGGDFADLFFEHTISNRIYWKTAKSTGPPATLLLVQVFGP